MNKAIGTETGCWKAGMLVEDAAGSVAAALQKNGMSTGAEIETKEPTQLIDLRGPHLAVHK